MSSPEDASSRRSCRQGPMRPGVHYYFDELGRMVFTAQFLLERGYCCKSGCRHCPYGYGPEGKKRDEERQRGASGPGE
jgi:hypothetical protein